MRYIGLAVKSETNYFLLKPWNNNKLIKIIRTMLKESVINSIKAESPKSDLYIVLENSAAMIKLLVKSYPYKEVSFIIILPK